MVVEAPQLPQHQGLKGKSIAEIAAAQGQDVDAFLDLAVAENLDTVFVLGEINVDPEAVATLLTSPYTIAWGSPMAHTYSSTAVSALARVCWAIGCVSSRSYPSKKPSVSSPSSRLRHLAFMTAADTSWYGGDLTIFDADTVQPLPEDIVHDFPNNGWRIRERAQGIAYTVVNGTVLIEHGEHTALPGRIHRNALYAV